jgi:hypothetical protein
MPRELLNEKPFGHVMRYGTAADASRCDFADGLTLERPRQITEAQFASDLLELAG